MKDLIIELDEIVDGKYNIFNQQDELILSTFSLQQAVEYIMEDGDVRHTNYRRMHNAA